MNNVRLKISKRQPDISQLTNHLYSHSLRDLPGGSVEDSQAMTDLTIACFNKAIVGSGRTKAIDGMHLSRIHHHLGPSKVKHRQNVKFHQPLSWVSASHAPPLHSLGNERGESLRKIVLLMRDCETANLSL